MRMDLRKPIVILGLAATLLPLPARAEGDLERARREFVCKPEAAEQEYKDDLFDETEIPSAVARALGEEQADRAAEAGAGGAETATHGPEGEGPAPGAEDEATGPDESAIQEWRDAVERYQERVLEFATEASRKIQREYSREAVELQDLYQRQIGRADIEEKQLREQAIAAHERFVQEHPDSPYTPRRMFRLAELYYELSTDEWIAAADRYKEMEILLDQGKLDFLPEPPRKDLRRSIALYKRIIQKFPDYEDIGAVYYTLGFCYSDDSSRHLDPERAEQTYLALLENVEESPYRAQAYFQLGDLYFEENQNERALAYYREIVDEIERRTGGKFNTPAEERLYELALYKLAWAYYKLDDLPVAMQRFMTLLDWAEHKEKVTGKQADLKPESVRYLAISFSDSAVEKGVSPIGFAEQVLTGHEQKPWAFEVLVELAGILQDQARHEDAIDAYRRLQEIKPLHPLGPEFQNKIIVLYQNLIVPDQDAAAHAREDLTNRYGLESEWYQANKNDKDATALATKYILESLQSVAYAYHSKAQQTGDPNDYLLAARKYVEYLTRYPFAENAYELNYYLADCYFRAGDTKFKDDKGEWTTGYAAAIDQYAYLFGFPETSHQKDAIVGIMYAHNYIWRETEGATVDKNPASLAALKPELGQKTEFARAPLSELEIDYVRSIRWVQREVPDQKDLPVLLYDIGQIYYYKNHLERARSTFMELIERFPQTNYASYGAGLIVDSYRYTGDLARMRDATERFAMLNLGEDAALRGERNEVFATLSKQSLFKDGELAYGLGRYECALLSFLEYYDLYGSAGTDREPQQIDDIVYDIALSYAKVGKAEDSTRYYELLLERFPHSEQAPNTFWKMAQNYEQLFELERAIDYYEDLIRYHPDHQDVANALYNSGFLAIGLERFADAARAYEKYHDKYADAAESPLLLYRAAELWEAEGNTREAKRLFEKWLAKYGSSDADRWVETQFKLARYARDAGRARDADRMIQAIADSYPALREELIAQPGIGLGISAEIGFAPVQRQIDEFIALEVPDTQDPDRLAEAVDRMLAANVELDAALDAFVIQYPAFEWQTAALYYKGLASADHGTDWLDAPNPFDGESEDPDEQDRFIMYDDALRAQAKPFEDKAVSYYQYVVQFARDKKRYTKWVGKALEELSRVDPNTWPVPKPESTTVIPSDNAALPELITELPKETSSREGADAGVRFASTEARP